MKFCYFVFLVAMLSCVNDSDSPAHTLICLERKIREIRKKADDGITATIWQYSYNGQTVYYIPPYYGNDIPSELLNDNCEFICSPDGGITGNGDGRCPDFFDRRTDETLIWLEKFQRD